MKKIKMISPAKLNLTLEIVERLSNGFHNLRSVMVKTRDLFDEVELIFDENGKDIKIFCDDPKVPVDEKNICWKIAEQFFQKTGKSIGLVIKLKKIIPVMAGLGGGSSNGASVLLGLNEYFRNVLGFEKMVTLASAVGKDIPFFLQKERAAYVSGMGEELESLENFPKLNFLIINPDGEIETPLAYKKLDEKMWFMDNKNRKNISLKMVENTSSFQKISSFLYNDFDVVAEEMFPQVKLVKNALISLGALGASLTGKGPTIFAIFENRQEAVAVKKVLQENYPFYFIALG